MGFLINAVPHNRDTCFILAVFWGIQEYFTCYLYSLTSFCLLLEYLASEVLPSTTFEIIAPE